MEQQTMNGVVEGIPNGLPHSPSQEELERELPLVHDGQVPLAELVSRMAQAVYAELTELAETWVTQLLLAWKPCLSSPT